MRKTPTPNELIFFASDFPLGVTLLDTTDAESGLRLLVLKGPFSFCAYVGVKADHVLASLEDFEFSCHFGISFNQWGTAGAPQEEGWFWWGWDYAHFTDHVDYASSLPPDAPPEAFAAMQALESLPSFGGRARRNRTLGEVVEDGYDVLVTLKMALAKSAEYASLVVAH